MKTYVLYTLGFFLVFALSVSLGLLVSGMETKEFFLWFFSKGMIGKNLFTVKSIVTSVTIGTPPIIYLFVMRRFLK